MVYAAETNTDLHADYYANTGVTPYPSSEAMLADVPDDSDMLIFGSNCRSVARPGKHRGLGAQDDDWHEFERVFGHLKTSNILGFAYENVDDLLIDKEEYRAGALSSGSRKRRSRSSSSPKSSNTSNISSSSRSRISSSGSSSSSRSSRGS